MKSSPDTDRLLANLCAERDAAEAFVVLLKAEQEALRRGAASDVERLAPEKIRMADALARHTAARLEALGALGLQRSAAGMQAWVVVHARNGTARAAWQALRKHAAQARALNETNGKLIELRLRHCRQALSALEQACGDTTVYGPQGHTIPPAASRTVTAV